MTVIDVGGRSSTTIWTGTYGINAFGIAVRWQSTDTFASETVSSVTPTETTPPPPTASPSNTAGAGLSTGAKAGIGVGCAAAVLLLLNLAWLLYRARKRKQKKKQKAASPSSSDIPQVAIRPNPQAGTPNDLGSLDIRHSHAEIPQHASSELHADSVVRELEEMHSPTASS
jgi:hypothetical protein